MLVSFVIPLFNCLPLTQAMLASLRATLPAGLSHEIIFVEDGGTDGTRAWLSTLQGEPFRVLLNERNLGYAAANNRAATTARGDYLALLNNDLILQPGWLEPMLAAQQRLGPRAGLVGNLQRDAKSGIIDHAGLAISTAGKPVHVRAAPHRLIRWLQPEPVVPAVTGACVVIRRDLWQELGGFDEGYMNGGEDIDLCYRARAAGRVNVVATRSVVRHHVSSSPGRKARDEENSRRLARRWQREFAADAIRPWCRDYLAQAVACPRSREYRLALAASAFLAGLRRNPPAEAVTGVAHGMARELARWDQMFPR